jgi:hypothetical protein
MVTARWGYEHMPDGQIPSSRWEVRGLPDGKFQSIYTEIKTKIKTEITQSGENARPRENFFSR